GKRSTLRRGIGDPTPCRGTSSRRGLVGVIADRRGELRALIGREDRRGGLEEAGATRGAPLCHVAGSGLGSGELLGVERVGLEGRCERRQVVLHFLVRVVLRRGLYLVLEGG